MTISNLPPISFSVGGSSKNEPLVRQAKTLPRKKRQIALHASFIKPGVKPDEKVVARLLELKPNQKHLKLKGKSDRPQEAVEFDNLLVSEIERGVSPLELAILLGYETSCAITKRYGDIKTKYSKGFNSEGKVRNREQNA